ncbi:MAG: hypothetical protein WBE98_12180, partial [Gammaproteobacteria bacterium]
RAMSRASTVIKEGVRIIQGTPTSPLQKPTLFLNIVRHTVPGEPPRTIASLSMARPGRAGYVIKELIADLAVEPKAAVEKAVAIAKRGDVEEIYLNADLSKLPFLKSAAAG